MTWRKLRGRSEPRYSSSGGQAAPLKPRSTVMPHSLEQPFWDVDSIPVLLAPDAELSHPLSAGAWSARMLNPCQHHSLEKCSLLWTLRPLSSQQLPCFHTIVAAGPVSRIRRAALQTDELFEISHCEVSMMSTSSVMAGFASHRRHNGRSRRLFARSRDQPTYKFALASRRKKLSLAACVCRIFSSSI